MKNCVKSLADPGGAPPARAPPTGSISFIFAYVFAEKCTLQRLAPPPNGLAPPQREILDPPLKMEMFLNINKTPVCFEVFEISLCDNVFFFLVISPTLFQMN